MSLIVDIKKRLGSFSLSAQLEAGEGVTGILGSSGCGKSMTLKCIAGIERPDSGHIELDGVVLYDSRKRIDLHPQQRRVGYLFQNYALFPNMTLRQNILCGLRNQPDKAQRVKEADDMIAMMGLQGLEKHRPYQLSGGQQQRAALGRILVNKPRLLMLDEPFSALDTYLRERLQAEMRELLKSYGGPVLLVTHSRDEAYRLCRSIAVMDQGSATPSAPDKGAFRGSPYRSRRKPYGLQKHIKGGETGRAPAVCRRLGRYPQLPPPSCMTDFVPSACGRTTYLRRNAITGMP